MIMMITLLRAIYLSEFDKISQHIKWEISSDSIDDATIVNNPFNKIGSSKPLFILISLINSSYLIVTLSFILISLPILLPIALLILHDVNTDVFCISIDVNDFFIILQSALSSTISYKRFAIDFISGYVSIVLPFSSVINKGHQYILAKLLYRLSLLLLLLLLLLLS